MKEAELLQECEACLRRTLAQMEASGFLPHIVTTALETLLDERERQEFDVGPHLRLVYNREDDALDACEKPY